MASQAQHGPPHDPFLEALSRLEEGSSEWDAVNAGFLTLALVDDWTARRPAGHGEVARDTRRRIAGVQDNGTRMALLAIADIVIQLPADGGAAVIGSALFSYAQALEYQAQWALASDVYQSLAIAAERDGETEMAIRSLLRHGYCQRSAGALTTAAAAYRTAEIAATSSGLPHFALRARVGVAKTHVECGDLGQAERELRAVLRETAAAGATDVEGVALHDLATIAIARQDYSAALDLGSRALPLLSIRREQDRLLADMATALIGLGDLPAATDLLDTLATTGTEPTARETATRHLMDIASRLGDRVGFQSALGALQSMDLPAPAVAEVWLTAARGWSRFHEVARAREAVTMARNTASTHGVEQVQRAAEALAQELGVTWTPATPGAAVRSSLEDAAGLRDASAPPKRVMPIASPAIAQASAGEPVPAPRPPDAATTATTEQLRALAKRVAASRTLGL